MDKHLHPQDRIRTKLLQCASRNKRISRHSDAVTESVQDGISTFSVTDTADTGVMDHSCEKKSNINNKSEGVKIRKKNVHEIEKSDRTLRQRTTTCPEAKHKVPSEISVNVTKTYSRKKRSRRISTLGICQAKRPHIVQDLFHKYISTTTFSETQKDKCTDDEYNTELSIATDKTNAENSYELFSFESDYLDSMDSGCVPEFSDANDLQQSFYDTYTSDQELSFVHRSKKPSSLTYSTPVKSDFACQVDTNINVTDSNSQNGVSSSKILKQSFVGSLENTDILGSQMIEQQHCSVTDCTTNNILSRAKSSTSSDILKSGSRKWVEENTETEMHNKRDESTKLLEQNTVSSSLDTDISESSEQMNNDLIIDHRHKNSSTVSDKLHKSLTTSKGSPVEIILPSSDTSQLKQKQKSERRPCISEMTEYDNVYPERARKSFGRRGNYGWEDSLRQHPPKTVILQVGCESESSKTNKNKKGRCSAEHTAEHQKETNNSVEKTTKKRDSTKKKSNTEIIVLENEQQVNSVIESEPDYGKLVWAHLAGEKWWPGLVIKGSQVYLKGGSTNMSWIFWFGDHKVSQIQHEKIVPFANEYNCKFNKKVKKAVVEALRECWRRNNRPSDLDSDEALLKFAGNGFMLANSSRRWTFDPIPDNPVPEYVLERMKKIGEEIRSRAARKSCTVETHDLDDALEALKSGTKKITEVCIGCLEFETEIVCQHPIFEGGLCLECKKSVMESIYAFGNDGLHAYCAVCGSGGKLFICDSMSCSRVYCFSCVEDLCGQEITAKIKDRKSWLCFLCTPYKSSSHGMIKPKENWEQKIVSFFDTGFRIERPNLEYFKEKRPIRVLSLFDGIGTCKLALDQLGIPVDIYYSSEVDIDALMVTRANHGENIVQIGDVQLLNYNKLPDIGPVDLLIGGSPCNDFSLANPDRKGFGGSGVLFFDFFRILKYLQINYRDQHLFWLYENVASMKTEYMAHISRFLDCQPALWDSKYFTAQHRARYFWGNIPGLYSTPEISTNLHKTVSLNSSLEPNCNRQAVIPKLRTVTTRTNSLRFGKKDEIFPIQMDGEDDGIWIPELERVFGFPSHYTDVGNLPATRRQKLIGKAWCLPVIKHILSPLKEYFSVQEKN